VWCIDDLSTGQKRNLNPHVKLIRMDVRSISPGFRLSGANDLHQIYHLACPASPVAYQQSPLRTTDVGYNGTRAVLELAEATGARLVIVSTSEVYGQPLQHPQKETLWSHINPLGLRACYDGSKMLGEVLALAYRRERGVDVRIARTHNSYGSRLHPTDGRVVSNFIIQALQKKPLTIYGDGLQTRCFCYVDDMISGFTALMNIEKLPDPPVINLGSDDEHNMLHLADLINNIAGNPTPLEFCDLPQDDPIRRKPDLTLARKWLRWKAGTPLREGLTRTVAYFSQI